MDGSINVEVRASGYIQAAFFANNEDYGFHIHDALSGSMHDHVLNIKADFDIAGTANTVRKISNVATKEVYPWSFNKTRSTMKLARSDITNEDHSRFNWADNGLTQVVVINKDALSKFGEPRGYRIAPLSGTAHLTVEDSSNLINAANWANHDIQVTRQHDTEPRAAHAYNSQDVAHPVINFDDFFNSESLEQEDLVMWFNLGMHHVPHTGDLPNTVFTAAHSGIQFTPHNYLLGDPSKESVNMVRLSYGGGSATVNKFGQGTGNVCPLAYEPLVPDLEGYIGDVVIRKYPFNPNEPFYETDSIS
jgi:primary-amine oxidase